MSLFQELKRRNVIKVALAYIVVAWLVAQVLQLVFESFGTPDWVMKSVLVLLAAGLAFAVMFAWIFEMTPEGLRREREVDRNQSITPQTGQKLNKLIFAVMALAIAYFAYDKFILTGPQVQPSPVAATGNAATQNEPAAAAEEPDRSIAVLPFVDMSPEQDQDYFTDGLTENLLNALAQLQELKVAGRTSSFAFKNQNVDLRSIGNELGVANLLEGSVQKSGEQVRITAQLINADDGYHLWSQTYDRTLQDIFAVQDEIANEVAKAMRVTLLGHSADEHPAPSQNSATAYNEYLKGLYERNRGSMEGHQQAMVHFKRALQLDPEMALAWAGLAMSLDYTTGFSDNDFKPGYEEAESHARRAIELDPALPEGYMALASIQLAYHWDWAGGEASLNRAHDLRPGDPKIRRELALLLSQRGQFDEALAELRQVAQQDPLDLTTQLFLAGSLRRAGQFEQAQSIYDHALSVDPQRPILHYQRGLLQLKQGNHQLALQEFAQEKFEFLKLTGLAIAHHQAGQPDQSKTALQDLISAAGESASYQIAQVYARWGDADNAISWLERGYSIRDPGLQFLANDGNFKTIEEDPRFQAFLRKMNFVGLES